MQGMRTVGLERHRRWLAWLALGLGAFALSVMVRWNWLDSGLTALVSGVLPDDAFYYFEIAHRVWAGEGVTFDGTAPATGLHLLWLGLILPLFALFPAGSAKPVIASLWLATGLMALASVLVARITWRWTRRWDVAVALGACLTVNPWVVRESLNGLETALALAALAASVLGLVRYVEAPSRRRAAELTGLLVLTLLARSDALVVVAPACAVLLARRAWWRDAALVAGGSAAGVAALSLLNWLRTGSFLQSSATAVPWLFHANWNRVNPGASPEQVRQHGWDVFQDALRFTENALGPPQVQLFWLCAGALLLALVWRLALRRAHPVTLEDLTPLAILAGLTVGLVALHFIHGYVRWLPRPWYFVPASLGVCLAPAVLARLLVPSGAGARLASTVAALALGLGAVTLGRDLERTQAQQGHHSYPWQREMLEAGLAVSERLPKDAVVGAFNSGIIAYVSEQTVVNLDGVVNEDAARALKRHELLAYMRERQVRYLVDYPAMWQPSDFIHCTWPYWGGSPPAPREQFRVDLPGTGWPSSNASILVAELPAP
jgi:hypothetical protein